MYLKLQEKQINIQCQKANQRSPGHRAQSERDAPENKETSGGDGNVLNPNRDPNHQTPNCNPNR